MARPPRRSDPPTDAATTPPPGAAAPGRPARTDKQDDESAHSHWGAAYDRVPKAVFAVVAWHLASEISVAPGSHGAAAQVFTDRLRRLANDGLIDVRKSRRALRALEARP